LTDAAINLKKDFIAIVTVKTTTKNILKAIIIQWRFRHRTTNNTRKNWDIVLSRPARKYIMTEKTPWTTNVIGMSTTV